VFLDGRKMDGLMGGEVGAKRWVGQFSEEEVGVSVEA
jgi:hypothetical protein